MLVLHRPVIDKNEHHVLVTMNVQFFDAVDNLMLLACTDFLIKIYFAHAAGSRAYI